MKHLHQNAMGRNVFPMLCLLCIVAGLIMGDQPNVSLYKYAIIDESLFLNPF